MGANESMRLDTLFDVLRDEQRRALLYSLRNRPDTPVSVEELADDVAEDGNRERAETRLRHSHLPRLARTTAVEYDDRSRTVLYRGCPLLERALDRCLVYDGR